MLCGGFERHNGAYSERETDIKGLKKGRDLLGGEGQVECFHTCQEGMILVSVSAWLYMSRN